MAAASRESKVDGPLPAREMRVSSWLRTTPGRLRLFSVAVAVVLLAFWLIAAGALSERRDAARSVGLDSARELVMANEPLRGPCRRRRHRIERARCGRRSPTRFAPGSSTTSTTRAGSSLRSPGRRRPTPPSCSGPEDRRRTADLRGARRSGPHQQPPRQPRRRRVHAGGLGPDAGRAPPRGDRHLAFSGRARRRRLRHRNRRRCPRPGRGRGRCRAHRPRRRPDLHGSADPAGGQPRVGRGHAAPPRPHRGCDRRDGARARRGSEPPSGRAPTPCSCSRPDGSSRCRPRPTRTSRSPNVAPATTT